jgi:signal transduction histidine kinase
VEPLAREARAVITTEIPESPVSIQGDPGALQQLFTNLLLNAVQVVDEGGRIHVAAHGDQAGATVLVRDNGDGIPPERLARIRDPFFSTRPNGTGLGLAIADRIAAAHHAEIEIDSEVGRGTEVRVRFGAAAIVMARDEAQSVRYDRDVEDPPRPAS